MCSLTSVITPFVFTLHELQYGLSAIIILVISMLQLCIVCFRFDSVGLLSKSTEISQNLYPMNYFYNLQVTIQ